MAQNKLILSIFLLLVTILCQEFQATEGRNMKLERANELTQKLQNANKILKNEEARNINSRKNLHELVQVSKSTSLGYRSRYCRPCDYANPDDYPSFAPRYHHFPCCP
ncbi:hypothetical protein OWV82_010395 [Melia azedarach]|uniref:Uncharacterized protein n=1 Tax=Melia azedarach TaxID=155640 RepID=A0ACC1Y4V8_MELAZ|nr:hypothetical protein OWV82_010395 [Melia azedarach]